METPPDAIFEQAGMWKEGGTMSFQDIQRVTRIEEDTREKKLQAQAQARQIIAEAQKAGTAAVEAARRQARDQVSQWMEEAERLGREETARMLAANDQACQAMCRQARGRLSEAADLIVRRVVDS